MLLLKGDQGKGLIVDSMMSRGRVCTIAYTDFPLHLCGDDTWRIDSNEYNVDELIEGIEEINAKYNGEDFTFIVIYTNETQEDLANLIQWVEDNKRVLNCAQVLVTCV